VAAEADRLGTRHDPGCVGLDIVFTGRGRGHDRPDHLVHSSPRHQAAAKCGKRGYYTAAIPDYNPVTATAPVFGTVLVFGANPPAAPTQLPVHTDDFKLRYQSCDECSLSVSMRSLPSWSSQRAELRVLRLVAAVQFAEGPAREKLYSDDSTRTASSLTFYKHIGDPSGESSRARAFFFAICEPW
jgi:hypothetical protein